MLSLGKIKQIIMTLLLCVVMLSFSLPVMAETKISPELKEQVLQIIRENPQVIIDSVQAYQQKKQQENAEKIQKSQEDFISKLKNNPTIIIGDSPSKGAIDNKIVMVEFSDFECPFCAEASKTVKEFITKHQNEVKLVYKHFPLLQIHPQALPAAKASWAAHQQGKFWQYHDELFANQKDLGEDFYIATAKKLGLDVTRFNSDRNSKNAELSVRKDFELGVSVGVTGTPFFVFNDQAFSGAVQLSELEEVLTKIKQ